MLPPAKPMKPPPLSPKEAERSAAGTVEGIAAVTPKEAVLKAGALQNAILNSANFFSIATDENGVIQIFNVGAERMLGYAAADVLNRITPADISDPQELIARARALSVELGTPITPGFEALVFKALRGIEDIYELTYIRKDGSRFPALVSVTGLRDAQDAIIGYLLIGTDNTARKQATEALEVAKVAAEAANRAKSAFLASMSHEIRTPMNAILGYAQLMERDPALTPGQSRHLQTIHRSGEHLMALINDVLEVSRIESGRAKLAPTTFDLPCLFRDMETMFRVRTDAKGLRLEVETAPNFPRYVVADEGKLRQILINVIGNAVKFTGDGGIAVRARAEAGGRLVVEVQDSGPGIPAEQIGFLFRAFSQADAGTAKGGTGLGLVISRGLAGMMGGSLAVVSEVGRGSTFCLEVHIEEGREEQVAVRAPAKTVTRVRPGQGPFRILIVDDKEENVSLLRELLGSVGFETREARNGVQALAVFGEWSPHAILMDMRMPVMDGYEATRRIKATEQGRKTTVIAVTASAFEDSRKEAMDTGIDGYLRKPFQHEDVFDALRERLGLEYDYADVGGAEAAAPPTASGLRERLGGIAADLRAHLRDAIAEGDSIRLPELIREVAAVDAQAGQTLQALADRYDYEGLLALLGEGD